MSVAVAGYELPDRFPVRRSDADRDFTGFRAPVASFLRRTPASQNDHAAHHL